MTTSAPPSKLRLILCGAGRIGRYWAKVLVGPASEFETVAIVEPDEKKLGEVGQVLKLPADKRFASLEAALERVPADAVLIAAPSDVHCDLARLAFAKGLHVMTEKPMADSLENAKLMVSLARKAKRQLVVSQNYRYKPEFETLRKLLADKVVGEFGHGHLDFYVPEDCSGNFRQTLEFPLLRDMAVHHLDLIRFITGRNILKVFAQAFRPGWSWFNHQSGTKLIMELDGGESPNGLPADSLPFSYSGDWSARGRHTNWGGDWRLQCSEGSIHLIGDQIAVYRVPKGVIEKETPAAEKIPWTPTADAGQAQILASFAQAIRSGQPAPTGGDDNLWSFGAVIAATLSAQQARPVDVARAIGKRKTRMTKSL